MPHEQRAPTNFVDERLSVGASWSRVVCKSYTFRTSGKRENFITLSEGISHFIIEGVGVAGIFLWNIFFSYQVSLKKYFIVKKN